MRVLILAESCNPDFASTPMFAYCAVRAIANYAEVVLVTQIRNRDSIKRAGMGSARVEYINTERIVRPLWKLGLALRGHKSSNWLINSILDYPRYFSFEWLAARRFGPALRRGEFDLVHRNTPWNGVQPSYMASHCPQPFLLGPLNDTLPWPARSTAVRRREMAPADYPAEALLPLYRRLPYQRSKWTRAGAILACYDHTMAGLPAAARARAINFPEVGYDPQRFLLPTNPPQPRKTIIFVGRLVPFKQPDVLVRAFAASTILRRHRLLIVGAGPERPLLEKLIAQHDLADCVELAGARSNAELGQLLREAEIFAFPSIHETGGGVLVEAMACGLPCVVADYGGPATLIGPERGVKVAVTPLAGLAERFRLELERLVADDERSTRLGLAAQRHTATYYSWDAKARKTVEIYEWLLGRRERKPDFWDQPVAN